MWMFKDESGKSFYLKVNSPFIIGRTRGDLILSEDGSISRVHASIQVTSEKCVVTDTKSKYGTFLLLENERTEQITGDYTVKPGDRVRFGLQTSILTFRHESIVVLTSSVNPQEKRELERTITEIGGRMVSEFTNECTHLTVSSTKLTAKLACSLAAGLPIVSPDYWKSVKSARDSGTELPDPLEFTPVLDDTAFHTDKTSLLPNPSRKTVFSNLLFVFFRVNQEQVYGRMIALAGGKSAFFGSKSFDKKMLYDGNTRLILYSEDNTPNEPYKIPGLKSLQEFLRKFKRRMIPDTEVPLAILYASSENCCNPEFHYATLLRAPREPKVLEGDILVPETQDFEGIERKRVVLPETGSYGTAGTPKAHVNVPETEFYGTAGTSNVPGTSETPIVHSNVESCENRERSRSSENDEENKEEMRFLPEVHGNVPETESYGTAGTPIVYLNVKSESLEVIKTSGDRKRSRSSEDEGNRGEKRARVEESQENEEMRVFSCIKMPKADKLERVGIHEFPLIEDDPEDIESQKLTEIRRIFSGGVEASQGTIIPETNEDENFEDKIFKEPLQKKVVNIEPVEENDDQDEWTRSGDESKIGGIDENLENKSDQSIGNNRTILRQEFFSGQMFGKRFRKVPVHKPENRISEWAAAGSFVN